MHFQVKMDETVQRTYIERSKQEIRYCYFYTLKCIPKINHYVFGLCPQTVKVQYMYLAFKNVKISSTKGQQWSKT